MVTSSIGRVMVLRTVNAFPALSSLIKLSFPITNLLCLLHHMSHLVGDVEREVVSGVLSFFFVEVVYFYFSVPQVFHLGSSSGGWRPAGVFMNNSKS